MTDFVFTELVPTKNMSCALGASPAAKLTDLDLNKAVRYGTANNVVLASTGEAIDGFLKSVEPYSVNNGFGFGGVQMEGRVTAQVGTNQGATPMAVRDVVVADNQAAVGTASNALVRTGTVTAGQPAWRCIRIVSGTGAAGSIVILERI